MKKHTPVLQDTVIEALHIAKGKRYIDATGGEGGHTQAIVAAGGSVLVLDADPDQASKLVQTLSGLPVTVIHGNFRSIDMIAQQSGYTSVDGVLFDFGLSMMQLESSGRGFSYRKQEEPLDMRLDPKQEGTAASLIASKTEDELYDLLAKNAEEYYSQSIAHGIIRQEKNGGMQRVKDLILAIDSSIPETIDMHTKEHIYARIFQALRIAVNDEYGAIREGVAGAVRILKPNARLVTITFHSGEDRLIKQMTKTMPLSIIPVEQKRAHERRSFERSARVRVYEKK